MDERQIDEALYLSGLIAGILLRTTPAALRAASVRDGLQPEYARMIQAVAELAERIRSGNDFC